MREHNYNVLVLGQHLRLQPRLCIAQHIEPLGWVLAPVLNVLEHLLQPRQVGQRGVLVELGRAVDVCGPGGGALARLGARRPTCACRGCRVCHRLAFALAASLPGPGRGVSPLALPVHFVPRGP